MITEVFEIALIIAVIEDLRFWKTFKQFSKEREKKIKKLKDRP